MDSAKLFSKLRLALSGPLCSIKNAGQVLTHVKSCKWLAQQQDLDGVLSKWMA